MSVTGIAVSVTWWKPSEGDGSSLSHVRHARCALGITLHNTRLQYSTMMCNDNVRCPNAAQVVMTKDALQLIKLLIFGGSVMYSDDIGS